MLRERRTEVEAFPIPYDLRLAVSFEHVAALAKVKEDLFEDHVQVFFFVNIDVVFGFATYGVEVDLIFGHATRSRAGLNTEFQHTDAGS